MSNQIILAKILQGVPRPSAVVLEEGMVSFPGIIIPGESKVDGPTPYSGSVLSRSTGDMLMDPSGYLGYQIIGQLSILNVAQFGCFRRM